GLGVLAKQTAAPAAAIGAIAWLWQADDRPRRLLVATAIVVPFINIVFVLQRAGSPQLLHYSVANAMNHLNDTRVYMPGGLWPAEFTARYSNSIDAWLREAFRDPPPLWRTLGVHVWLFLLLIASTYVCCIVHKKRPPAVAYLACAAL